MALFLPKPTILVKKQFYANKYESNSNIENPKDYIILFENKHSSIAPYPSYIINMLDSIYEN